MSAITQSAPLADVNRSPQGTANVLGSGSMSNILKVPHQQAIQALRAKGWSVRHIARTLGINRRTVKRYAASAQPKCTTEVITGSRSLCADFREVIAPMLELGLSAQRIYQDLVAGHGFGGSYPSVSRYVAKLKASEPERIWRIECQPGEELQVDFGLGAPLVEPGGKTRRTWLFRAVLGFSRKGYSEVVLRQDTETFLRVIENAVRYFGGVPRLLNFDNLKAAVIKADWYDPAMNPKLADFCRHYGMTPMPCRAHTPPAQRQGGTLRGLRQKQRAQGVEVRLARRTEHPPASLGGAGGRQARPWHHPAAGGRDVRGGKEHPRPLARIGL